MKDMVRKSPKEQKNSFPKQIEPMLSALISYVKFDKDYWYEVKCDAVE
jgi:hypothetical protein